jgi:hypothetical protein
LRHPALLFTGLVAIAGLSLLVGDSVRFDAHGWLRWGREIGLGQGSFDTTAMPSWKPIPLLLTVPLAWTGPLAPTLFLIVLRTAGFVALALVFRVAARRDGLVAGIVAVGALALVHDWWPTLLGGAIEPALVALGAGAVLAHQARRHALALALLALVALGREEALPLVALYGASRWRHGVQWPAAGALTSGVVLALWLGGDWLGSGDPFHGGELARQAGAAAAAAGRSDTALSGALQAVARALPVALWPLALVGAAAAMRDRDRTSIALLAAAGLWIVIDVGLVALGYPIQQRFLFPATAVLCLIAASGAATVYAWLTEQKSATAVSETS